MHRIIVPETKADKALPHKVPHGVPNNKGPVLAPFRCVVCEQVARDGQQAAGHPHQPGRDIDNMKRRHEDGGCNDSVKRVRRRGQSRVHVVAEVR